MQPTVKTQNKTIAQRSQLDIHHFLSDIISSQISFEDNLRKKIRKLNGTFLTSKIGTIDNIIDIIPINKEVLNKKILEPSCGRGIFLLRLLIKIYKKFPEKEIIYNFIENNLIFVDIEQEMIDKTKDNLNELYKFLFNENYDGNFHGYKYDFTKKFIENEASLFQTNNSNHPLANFMGKVDYIIGNPPYVSLYGRRDKKLNEQQRVYYLNNYNQFPAHLKNGKINLVMLFLEHSLDFLKKDGLLSFIIDVAFFETAYKHTRKYLLKNTNILSIDFNISDFDVASGQLILKLKKGKSNNNHLVKITDHDSNTKSVVEESSWNNTEDEYKFRINQCQKSLDIIEKIHEKKDKTLKNLYPRKNLRTCAMLLNMEDKFTSDKKESLKNINIYPYHQGSKGLKEKYGDLLFSKYFYYNKNLQDKINDDLKTELIKKGIKNKKRIGLGEIEIYDNPKIFIRQSAKEIIATYDKNKSSTNNSLYVFSLRNNKKETEDFLLFLCGLLNSTLITFYSQKMNIIRYAKGKQPQIKTSDLYTIRIPSDNFIQKKIADHTKQLYKDKKLKEKYILKIDNLIYEYYNITSEEVELIKEKVKSF